MFSVITWNVENLFRPKQTAPAAEQKLYQDKLVLLAGLINQEDPDVVALQEVGGLEPLSDLRQACGTYPHPAISRDFNDVPDAQTSLILCGPPGSEIGTGGFNRPDAGDDQRLFNLTNAIQDPARRYSRIHNGRGEMLDQIFVSEELFPIQQNGQRLLPVVDSLVDFTQLPSVTNNPGTRVGDVAPDHAPVKASFNI